MKKILKSAKELGKSFWSFTMTLFGETIQGIEKTYEKIKWIFKK